MKKVGEDQKTIMSKNAIFPRDSAGIQDFNIEIFVFLFSFQFKYL